MTQPDPMDEPDVIVVAHRFGKSTAAAKADLETVVALGIVFVNANCVSDVAAEPARSGGRPAEQASVGAREPAGAGLIAPACIVMYWADHGCRSFVSLPLKW